MNLTGYSLFIQQALKYGFSLFGLPKTGQTIEYQAGDDGTYKKGYPKTGARFTDNGDGTITDRATGLMFVKDGTGAGCNNGIALDWSNAIIFCEGLNFAGYTDWRLPNLQELISLWDGSLTVAPIVDPTFFPNTRAANYYTSTTRSNVTTWAITVNYAVGYQTLAAVLKTASHYVRPVRGG